MKIELGKCYRTRDGRKARVICVDRKGPTPVIALVDDGWIELSYAFHQCGDFIHSLGGGHSYDLVSEWIDYPPKGHMIARSKWLHGDDGNGKSIPICQMYQEMKLTGDMIAHMTLRTVRAGRPYTDFERDEFIRIYGDQ